MIKSLTVINPKEESLTIDLFNPDTSGLIIQNIDGLGASKADINVSSLATADGGIYSSSRLNERNIVIDFIMHEFPSVETNRHKVYQYFPVKKPVTLRIQTDERDVEITGYVESDEPHIFSELETVQVSIICPDPYFYASNAGGESFSGAEPMFEFPFSNESLSENLIVFGELRPDPRAILYYEGDVDSGMVIRIHAIGNASNITLYNTETHEMMKILTSKIYGLTGVYFSAPDDIIISTIPGNKYVRLLHNGVYYNIIGALDRGSDWFLLSHGDNIFTYTAESGTNNLLIEFSFRNAYGGV